VALSFDCREIGHTLMLSFNGRKNKNARKKLFLARLLLEANYYGRNPMRHCLFCGVTVI